MGLKLSEVIKVHHITQPMTRDVMMFQKAPMQNRRQMHQTNMSKNGNVELQYKTTKPTMHLAEHKKNPNGSRMLTYKLKGPQIENTNNSGQVVNDNGKFVSRNYLQTRLNSSALVMQSTLPQGIKNKALTNIRKMT